MKKESVNYRSYLLRMWQVEQNGEPAWRASLEEAESGKRRAFPDLDALFSYLHAETAEGPSAKKE